MRRYCTNCKMNVMLMEFRPVCPRCGKVFTGDMSIMPEEKIIERSKNRRSGKDVDRLDA